MKKGENKVNDIDEIVVAVQKGCDDQFERIVEDYQKQLFHYIYCIVGNVHDAEDLLQDTFFTAYKKIGQYKKDKSFLAWLYKIGRNKSLNYLKRSNPSRLTDLNEWEQLSQNNVLMTTPNDIHEKVGFVLKKLNITEREITLLHLVEERDYQEMALILGRSQATLRKRFERARKKFQELYNNYSKEDAYGSDETRVEKLFQV